MRKLANQDELVVINKIATFIIIIIISTSLLEKIKTLSKFIKQANNFIVVYNCFLIYL